MRQAFTLMPTATDEDWSNIAARLERLPQALDGYRRTLETGRGRGLVAGPHQVTAVVDPLGRGGAGGGWVGAVAPPRPGRPRGPLPGAGVRAPRRVPGPPPAPAA